MRFDVYSLELNQERMDNAIPITPALHNVGTFI